MALRMTYKYAIRELKHRVIQHKFCPSSECYNLSILRSCHPPATPRESSVKIEPKV